MGENLIHGEPMVRKPLFPLLVSNLVCHFRVLEKLTAVNEARGNAITPRWEGGPSDRTARLGWFAALVYEPEQGPRLK